MKQELNDELKKYADKIMNGDILNIPTFGVQDFKRISFYLFAKIFDKNQSTLVTWFDAQARNEKEFKAIREDLERLKKRFKR